MSSILIVSLLALGAMVLPACKPTEFSSADKSAATKDGGDGTGKKPPGDFDDDPDEGDGSDDPNGGPNGGPGGGNGSGGLGQTDGSVHAPKPCDSTNIQIKSAGQCPANYAAFAADDASTAKIACCPLPARDFFATGSSAVVRQGACQANELVTGVVGGGFGLYCTAINTSRYKLSAAKTSCYYGSGSAGGDGATACSAPPATMVAMQKTFGSDSCLGTPFGAAITKLSGRNCTDVRTSEILYSADDKPVKILP